MTAGCVAAPIGHQDGIITQKSHFLKCLGDLFDKMGPKTKKTFNSYN